MPPRDFSAVRRIGFMRSCELCDQPMLPSFTGHGYCLGCGFPSWDIPLGGVAREDLEALVPKVEVIYR